MTSQLENSTVRVSGMVWASGSSQPSAWAGSSTAEMSGPLVMTEKLINRPGSSILDFERTAQP